MKTLGYGFPHIGANREYKKSIERAWKEGLGSETGKKLESDLHAIQNDIISVYQRHVDLFPIGEVSPYDAMLDSAIMVGLYTPRNWREYYDLCRGESALEMTKWFNTNYHYLVPRFERARPENLSLNTQWIARSIPSYPSIDRPMSLIGPYTFMRLSKGIDPKKKNEFYEAIARLYRQLLREIPAAYIMEPAFIFDDCDIGAIQKCYTIIAEANSSITLFCYYDSVDWLPELYNLPVDGLGLDLAHGKENIVSILDKGFPSDKRLIAGIIDGRNVWKSNINEAIAMVHALSNVSKQLEISNAGPLYHLPYTLTAETSLPDPLMGRLSFAYQKLEELQLIANVIDKKEARATNSEPLAPNPSIQLRVANLSKKDFQRSESLLRRMEMQRKKLSAIPLLPTTTIGSFPQTAEIRKNRARYRAGHIDFEQYQAFVEQTIASTIKTQEEIGLDVLTHGECERTDMVEFFAEQLDGIATTQNGWVISYGTRGYRPPIIYGDIARPGPMTIRDIGYAQSLTKRPVKGMLTGPITILAWSFVRNDIPIRSVAYQIALALQEEVKDYERAGIGIIQIDEPAFREKAPNKRREWDNYFEWAIKAFRLCSATAAPTTQIHSHMCYSEFNDIIQHIAAMDFDVISIEATRSGGEVIDHFKRIDFDAQIGLGVYDIHSPAIPSADDISSVIERALTAIPADRCWINPDCGLKTRSWEEVIPALRSMVEQARRFREKIAASQ